MSSKEKILEVASELFAQNGYQETSIRQIAKKANANSAMISYYFGSKKALYENILYAYMDDFLQEVSNIKTNDEKTFLKEFIKAHMSILEKRGKYISYLMLRESATNFEQFKNLKNKYFEPIINILLKMLKSGKEKKIFKSFDENMLLQLIIGIDVMLSIKNDHKDLNELIDIAYDVFLHGICL